MIATIIISWCAIIMTGSIASHITHLIVQADYIHACMQVSTVAISAINHSLCSSKHCKYIKDYSPSLSQSVLYN